MLSPTDRRSLLRVVVAMCAGIALLPAADAGPAKTVTEILSAPIERRAVTSTSIAGIGYHANLQVLEIAFRSGAIYRYVAVPPAVFDGLMKAESKGRYFTRHIRNRFEFQRVEGARP